MQEAKEKKLGRPGKVNANLPMARSKMPEYTNWILMRHRCYNPLRKDYKWYGGRGIAVCERWMIGDGVNDGFVCFYLDMGSRPEGEGTVDRIDGDGNYEPRNCKWSHIAPQQRHKSSTAYIEFRGERLCRAEMARKYGIPFSALRERTEKLGWSIEEALTTPSVPIRKIGKIEYNGQHKSITEWADEFGIKYHTLLKRIHAGKTMGEALHTPIGQM